MTRPQRGKVARSRATQVVIGFVAIALVATACGDDASGDGSASEIEHVHGLGVDPADGVLYAATHSGLFRVSESGDVERVGDSHQDTMGFAVVGANRFLGSGHPEPGDDDLPPLLGLIESTDAGRTWEPRSMLGEADFHALVARHGLIYGYDVTQQRYMVSADGVDWELRSSPPGLISLAVDPTDPGRLVATTSGGVITSADGGRSWDPVEAPALAWVSWADDGTLAGAGPDGATHISTDAGATWTDAGTLPGPPEALLAIDEEVLVAAVSGQGLLRSDDGGATWRQSPGW